MLKILSLIQTVNIPKYTTSIQVKSVPKIKDVLISLNSAMSDSETTQASSIEPPSLPNVTLSEESYARARYPAGEWTRE